MAVKAYGNIFKNKKKEGAQPDYRGTFRCSPEDLEAFLGGETDEEGRITLEFSGWVKQGPKAGSYISGNLQLPQGSNGGGRPSRKQDDLDDDIPF